MKNPLKFVVPFIAAAAVALTALNFQHIAEFLLDLFGGPDELCFYGFTIVFSTFAFGFALAFWNDYRRTEIARRLQQAANSKAATATPSKA